MGEEERLALSALDQALAVEHHERLPSRLPRWRLDGSLFAALSTAANDLRPSLVTRDGESGFMIDAAEGRFALVKLDHIDFEMLSPGEQPWQVIAIAEERVADQRRPGTRWDAIDSLRFTACLIESNGCIAGPIELGKRYKMKKWPDLGALPSARALLRPYLRHATALARGNRSIGELLASAGTNWREALAFANACAMLDLLQAVDEAQ
jgi:hypothetical protein